MQIDTDVQHSAQDGPHLRRLPVLLVGTKAARRGVRPVLGGLSVVESSGWDDLPIGPAICIDARRLVHLSTHGIAALTQALHDGAVLAVPGSNAGPWPLCGLEPPSGNARREELDHHVASIAGLPAQRLDDPTLPLPAVFAVADASSLRAAPRRIGDIADPALDLVTLLPSVWCHHREVPLVTLAMIVKNEAPRITNAINLARRLVDEVVVYDTGSDDDTVALAKAAGAVVRCGYWDSDFSRARNEAIAMVRGDWVLILDGDDELVADAASAAAMRSLLPKLDRHHAVMLTVRNLVSAATGETDTPIRSRRLFPRSFRYVNRVHEVPKLPDGSEPTDFTADQVWIRHTGYVGDQADRVQRNVELARKRLDETEDPARRSLALFELGRALSAAGSEQEAFPYLQEAAEIAPGPDVRNLARLLWGLKAAPIMGREVAEEILAPVLAHGGAASDAARWVLVAVRPPDEALALLDQLTSVDFYFVAVTEAEIASARAYMRAGVGQLEAASDELALIRRPHDSKWAWQCAAMTLEAGHLAGAAAIIDDTRIDDLNTAVAALAAGSGVGGFAIVSTLWERFGAHPALVAYLETASPRGGFMAAMEARMLLLDAGMLHNDPLVQLVENGYGDEGDRFLAALVLDEVTEGSHRLPLAAADVPNDARQLVLDAVEGLLPELSVQAAAALAGV